MFGLSTELITKGKLDTVKDSSADVSRVALRHNEESSRATENQCFINRVGRVFWPP